MSNIKIYKIYQELIEELTGSSSYTFTSGIFIHDNTQNAIIFDFNSIYLFYGIVLNSTKSRLKIVKNSADLRKIINKHIYTQI